VKHPAQVKERDRIQRAATQRMSSRGYPYRARQRPAEMLQSVACLVGAGKTFLATALGHAAVRARHSVHFERAGQLLKRLKATRLDNSHDEQIRKLLRADLLILDDFCLQPMDATDTADIYEIILERHRAAATVVTSNREPPEWLALMADPLLAQSAIDRLQSAAYELVIDGESYRHRQKPAIPRTGQQP
jgi:DNA replication protein DnaC